MASDLFEKLNQLEVKVQRLSEQYLALTNSYREAKNESDHLKKILVAKEEEIKNFQNQHKITKIVSSIADDNQGSTELKLKINEFIREIDKCIAHLSE